MAEEQELTPEEKLLKVIQKGEEPESPTGEVEEAAEVSAEEAAAGGTTAPVAVIAPASGEAPTDVAPPSPVTSGVAVVSASSLRFRVLNKALLGAAAIFLCISCLEIGANIRSPLPPVTQTALTTAETTEPNTLLATLSDTLDIYSKKRIFGKPDPKIVPPAGSGTDTRLAGWRAYVRNNFNLLGLSQVSRRADDGTEQNVREAILVDKHTSNMHFLSVGQTILIEKQTVRLGEIKDEKVTLSVGDEKVTLD